MNDDDEGWMNEQQHI